MTHPLLKITYLPMTGRAEVTRLVLAFGGIPFEDVRVSGAALAALKPTLPLGQVPVIEVDGKMYAQSMAMLRYVGRLTGLYPTDALEALKVDMIVDTMQDIISKYVDVTWKTPDEALKAAKIQDFVTGGLPKIYGMLEKNVDGKYFLGDKPSIADVFVFDLINNEVKTTFPDFKLKSYPKVARMIATVGANEGIAAFVAKHQ